MSGGRSDSRGRTIVPAWLFEREPPPGGDEPGMVVCERRGIAGTWGGGSLSNRQLGRLVGVVTHGSVLDFVGTCRGLRAWAPAGAFICERAFLGERIVCLVAARDSVRDAFLYGLRLLCENLFCLVSGGGFFSWRFFM